jgi:hypothetical protein
VNRFPAPNEEMTMMKNVMTAGFVCLGLVACGGSKDEKKPDAKAPVMVAAPAQEALVASCVSMREQMFLCKDQAIDMMIAERAKVNKDMAATLADATKAAELKATGLTELEADGGGGEATLAARTEKCKAVAAGMPAQVPEQMVTMFNGLSACNDKPCADRIACFQPFVVGTLNMPAPAAK